MLACACGGGTEPSRSPAVGAWAEVGGADTLVVSVGRGDAVRATYRSPARGAPPPAGIDLRGTYVAPELLLLSTACGAGRNQDGCFVFSAPLAPSSDTMRVGYLGRGDQWTSYGDYLGQPPAATFARDR